MRYRSKKGKKNKEEEHEVFRQIYSEREHRSEISGEPLPFEFGPHMYFVFSHILGKQAYPSRAMVLNKENIILMTYDEHQLWEFNQHKILESPKLMESWAWVFELQERLRIEYYSIYQTSKWTN